MCILLAMAHSEHIITMERLREHYRDDILAIAERRGVENIRIFGSVARGNTHADSDIDFLYTRRPDTDLMDLGGLYMELSDLLGCGIDIVSETSLSPYMKDRILREATTL